MASKRVLLLFAHPALEKSRINRALIAAVRDLPGITFHDLYEQYPDFDINVSREQQLLLEHDVIVLQHPFYWYSCPALLKEWLDLVLEYEFAYGPGGTRLAGKWLLSALTTGGSAAAYAREGHNHYTMTELLVPFNQTARLCGMTYLPPFIVHGTVRILSREVISHYANDYRDTLIGLRDGALTPAGLQARDRLNHDHATFNA